MVVFPLSQFICPHPKGQFEGEGGGEALFGPNGPDFPLSLMFSFPNIIHPITFPGVQNFVAINSQETSAHGLPSVSWDVLFALTVGLHFIFGSVGIVVGQKVVVVVRIFLIWGVCFLYSFVFEKDHDRLVHPRRASERAFWIRLY